MILIKDSIDKLSNYGVSEQVTTKNICKINVEAIFTMVPEVLEGEE